MQNNLVQLKFKPTDIEQLILANQAMILQVLDLVVDNPSARLIINRAVKNVHDVLGLK